MKFDPALLRHFAIWDVYDPSEMDTSSRVTQRFPRDNAAYRYVLRDRSRWRGRTSQQPITRLARYAMDGIAITYAADRYSTEVEIIGDGFDRYCLTMMLNGTLALAQPSGESVAEGNRGLIYRGTPGTRLHSADDNARLNIWLEEGLLFRALERERGEGLRTPLRFAPSLDWSAGLLPVVRGMAFLLLQDLGRADGLAGNAVALAGFTDTLCRLVLQTAAHDHTGDAAPSLSGPVPRQLRRAEEFMAASTRRPIRLRDIAAAAGCSERTLHDVFRAFRATTPLAALRGMRLDRARADLQRSPDSIGTIARRYGFTNAGRFAIAYHQRFYELPSDTKRGA
jgi:AraC-like DNA-binding protein